MIQIKELKESTITLNEIDSVKNIVLPEICNYFFADDLPLSPYLIGSNLFFISLFMGLFLSKQIFFPIDPSRAKQSIDIEFVSKTDFLNKNDILPSTLPKTSLGKRTSPTTEDTVSTRPTPGGAAEPRTKSQPQKLTYTITCQQTAPAIKFGFSNPYKISDLPAKSSGTQSLPMDLEEVAPLAMTEVKDNDGDNSLELWQNGGRSNEGLGAPSALAEYLKNLHKKLKRTWVPPQGPAYHTKVLFRVDLHGNVVSTQLLSSSGNTDADASAIEAIAKAAPFGNLPKQYTHPFLDIAYTFNYSTDELNEVDSPQK